MTFKVGTKGCVFTLYHHPTKLYYRSAFSYRYATPFNVLWVSWFTNNTVIHELIRIFGKETFQVTVDQIYPTRNDAIAALKAFYDTEQPQFKSEWITDKKLPSLMPHANPKKHLRHYASHKGRNNPNYGRRHNNAISKMKRTQGRRANYVLKRWVVDEQGNERKILATAPLPKGWRYGRNTRNWSGW
jgi:hypothetical protein